MAKKKQLTTFVTGVGTLVFPFLNKARQYEGKGDYFLDTRIVLTGADADALVEMIDAERTATMMETGVPLHASCPYSPAKDADGNEIDGAIEVRCKLKAIIEIKGQEEPWIRQCEFLDANAAPLLPKPMLGAGTKARLKLEFYRWQASNACGVTPQPVAVQIVELVEYTGKSHASDFGSVDGGYVAPSQQPPSEGDSGAGAGSDF